MKKKKPAKVLELDFRDKAGLQARIRSNTLTKEEGELLCLTLDTVEYMCEQSQIKDTRLKTLFKRLIGFKSEKTQKIIEKLNQPNKNEDTKETEPQGSPSLSETQDVSTNPTPQKGKGHGRIGADAYTGAERIAISHPELGPGDNCPECLEGKVYKQKQPGLFIRITGVSPVQAKIYELEKLRCNLCGEIFQAQLPEDVAGESSDSKHYDETAKSMLVLLRYGTGLPMHRLSALQSQLGIPLPISTQWDKIRELGQQVAAVYDELIRQAAQGELFYNDDTGVKVLSLIKEIAEEKKIQKGKTRTGIFTTGILSVVGEDKIALFFSGRKHAGENFSDLLKAREAGLDPPIQMCDAKSGNTPKEIEVIESCCNTHARRKFVEVAEDFPDECLYVISDVFGEIYAHDAQAKQNGLTPEERLKFHQDKSGPIIDAFHCWLQKQFDQKLVEPNSSLGGAISYTLKHWEKLTRFLQFPGVPLDNNPCERMLKKAILHRKNSLFYQTERGARWGDIFMSLIYTCQLSNVNPFDYLTQLQIHATKMVLAPDRWFPWNYQETMAAISTEVSV